MNLNTIILVIVYLGFVLCQGPPPPRTKKDCKHWVTPEGIRKWKCFTRTIYPKKSWSWRTVWQPDGTYKKIYDVKYSFDDDEEGYPIFTPTFTPTTTTITETPTEEDDIDEDDDNLGKENEYIVDEVGGVNNGDMCGLRNLEAVGGGRIVGGRPAIRNEFPWMVGIETGESNEFSLRGGGAIVNKRWIVTAAHVFQGEPKISKYRGIIDTVSLNEAPVYVYFDRLIVHPDYKNTSGNFYNDIALLHTTKDMVLYPKRNGVNAICLPEPFKRFNGIVTVSGFGTTDEEGTPTEKLMTAELEVLDDKICRDQFKKEFKSRIMICAGRLSGGKDTCRGDSGGPMIKIERNRAYLIGVVSYGGYGMCARRNSGAVYTKVTQYVDWIRENTKDT